MSTFLQASDDGENIIIFIVRFRRLRACAILERNSAVNQSQDPARPVSLVSKPEGSHIKTVHYQGQISIILHLKKRYLQPTTLSKMQQKF